jgi:hypothetical protein
MHAPDIGMMCIQSGPDRIGWIVLIGDKDQPPGTPQDMFDDRRLI